MSLLACMFLSGCGCLHDIPGTTGRVLILPDFNSSPFSRHEDPLQHLPVAHIQIPGWSEAVLNKLICDFAPIIYHDRKEINLPANVDWYLQRCRIGFFDFTGHHPTNFLVDAKVKQSVLLELIASPVSSYDLVHSDGTRSDCKRRSFYLTARDSNAWSGSGDSLDWTTYVHIYANNLGGVTIQYWRFYAFNRGVHCGCVTLGDHEGDWEGVYVAFDDKLFPKQVIMPGHSEMSCCDWIDIEKEATHPVIYADLLGHTSRLKGHRDGIRQETWPGGHVQWPDGRISLSGSLIDVGEKCAPRNGQIFIRYSGMWGRPGNNFLGIVSGYWGPAFNETGMGQDGFITAWGYGMADPSKEMNGIKECFATRECP